MSKILEHYSRKDIQQAILAASRGKEVAIRFGEQGYGKRPDILDFPNDITDLAKSGATSFHISEEIWNNPLQLKPGMSKKQLDELRKGWDLIIDIDSRHFEIARKAAILFREALYFHGIKNLSVKFSGNNGFHIGIPTESFPQKFNNIPISSLFPEAPKLMASYLKQMVKEHLSASLLQQSLDELLKLSGKSREEITEKICKRCSQPALTITSVTLKCSKCSRQEQSFSEPQLVCPECMLTMQKIKEEIFLRCPRCSTQESLRDQKLFTDGKFNPFSLVDIDTVLISSRHLFRAPYSINEKSGLISLPIPPESLETFQKEQASLKKFQPGPIFLNRIPTEEAALLLTRAYEYAQSTAPLAATPSSGKKTYAPLKAAAQQQYFPPCIQLAFKGMEDGKKRLVFVLHNFLANTGYSHEEIEHLLLEWNKKNPEPLRENYIQAQLSWAKRQKQSIMPPNCNNPGYYLAMNICKPNALCRTIKNPVNYTLKSMKMQEQQEQREQQEKERREKQKKSPQPKEKPVREKKEKAVRAKKK